MKTYYLKKFRKRFKIEVTDRCVLLQDYRTGEIYECFNTTTATSHMMVLMGNIGSATAWLKRKSQMERMRLIKMKLRSPEIAN